MLPRLESKGEHHNAPAAIVDCPAIVTVFSNGLAVILGSKVIDGLKVVLRSPIDPVDIVFTEPIPDRSANIAPQSASSFDITNRVMVRPYISQNAMFFLLTAVVNFQAGITKHVRLASIVERVAPDHGSAAVDADVRLSEHCIVFEKLFARVRNTCKS
jgi:hypothetical protein